MNNEKTVYALCTLPSNDGNFHSTLKSATDGELVEALTNMEASPEGNLTRILGVKYEIKARTKAKNEAEAEKNSPQLDMESFLEAEKADNIISFPTATENTDDKVEVTVTESPIDTTTPVDNCVKDASKEIKDSTPTDTTETPAEVKDSVSNTDTPKPIEENEGENKAEEKKESTKVVEPELTPFEAAIQEYCGVLDIAPSNRQYTATDVFEKLSKEKISFPDRDSAYVINKLIDKSGKDQALCNAIMQEHKSYKKAFQYFAQKARSKEAGIELEGGMYLDRDIAYDLAVDYFFLDEAKAEAERKAKEEERKKKAEEEKKRKAEEKKAAKKSTTRKPRKKKGETEEVAATPADTPTPDTSTDTPSAEVSTEVKSDDNEDVVDTVPTDTPAETVIEPTPEAPVMVENDVTESNTTGVTEDNNSSTTEDSTEVTTEAEPVEDGSFEVKDSVIMDSPRPIEESVEEPVEEPSGQLSFTFI